MLQDGWPLGEGMAIPRHTQMACWSCFEQFRFDLFEGGLLRDIGYCLEAPGLSSHSIEQTT